MEDVKIEFLEKNTGYEYQQMENVFFVETIKNCRKYLKKR